MMDEVPAGMPADSAGKGSIHRRRRHRLMSPERWFERRLLPHLRATLAERGFISLHQLAHALLVIDGHEHLCAALIGALDRAGARVTRSIAHTHSPSGPIDRAEHVFAPLLDRPPYPRDVLRYLKMDHLTLSDDTIAFIAIAFEQHRLTGSAERVFLERLINARVSGQPCSARFADLVAWQALFDNNLWLVCRAVRAHVGYGLDVDDLIQEGSLGLMGGLERCDIAKIEKEAGLRYYLWMWIVRRIKRAIADTGRVVRVPVHMGEVIARVRDETTRLTPELGRWPTPRECAAALNVSPETVRRAAVYAQTVLSLDTLSIDQQDVLIACVRRDAQRSPADIVDARALHEAVACTLNALRERERILALLRFGLYDGETRTLEEVGSVLGVTRGRVHEIEKRVIKKLRGASRSAHLRDWL